MFDTLCDNLNLLMEEQRVSADELGRRTGIPASTIKKIRNRYNPNPTLTTLLPLAEYFSVSLGQLVGHEPLPKERASRLSQSAPIALQRIPLLTWEQAIHWPHTSFEMHTTVSTEHQYSQNAYALRVEEDNWENLAKETVLLIDPLLAAEHRDFVIVYKEAQPIPTLKQVLYDEEQIYLRPLVQGYHLTSFMPEHKILGVVVEYKKQLKKRK